MLMAVTPPPARRRRPLAAWGPRVSARRARQHLQHLQACGIGKRAVAGVTGLVENTVVRIREGRVRMIYQRTESKILLVSAADRADHSLVDAAPTWALIAELVEEGYRISRLAKLLGYTGNGIPLNRERISLRNANRVRVLHEALTGDALRPVPRIAPTQRSRWGRAAG